MVDFPNYIGVGIDESTAIIVFNKEIEVTGESAVIVVKNPKGVSKSKNNNLFGIKNLQLGIYTEGQKIKIQ